MSVHASMEAWVDLGCLPLTHLSVCLFVYFMCVSTWVPPHSRGGQKTAFRGQFFPSILLSQGLFSFYYTALCTSGELARDSLSSSSVLTTRVVGWQVVSPHWALFKCRGSGVALLARPTCWVVSLATHCFLSHRVSYGTWSSPILLEWLTSKAQGSSHHCLAVLGWWACSQCLTSYVAAGDPNSGSHACIASILTTLSHLPSPVHVTESKLSCLEL